MEHHPVDGVSGDSACGAGSVTRRTIYALVLLPIVPATSILGVVWITEFVGFGPFDEIRLFHLLAAILWVALSIAIWRGVIVWTLGRKWLTALTGMIPFAQVAYGQPLWDAGCISSDVLRVGQHEIGIGVWVWLTIWVWWGWEKTRMLRTSPMETDGGTRPPLSPMARRVVASIGSIPFIFGSFMMFFIAMEDFAKLSENLNLAWAFGLSSVVAVVTWIAIWHRSVVWSPRVWRRMIAGAVVLLVMPSVAMAVADPSRNLTIVLLGVLPVLGWGVWMAGTVSLWPMRSQYAGSRDASPRCLKCDYLLIGLKGTRCPECGDEPTLDVLWRATGGDQLE